MVKSLLPIINTGGKMQADTVFPLLFFTLCSSSSSAFCARLLTAGDQQWAAVVREE